MTVRLPPPDRVFAVRAVIPGDPAMTAVDELSKRLGAKVSESLRRGMSDLRLDPAPGGGAVALTATVNDWHAGAAAIRVITLLLLKAGPGWDVHGASVSAEPPP